jgi:hypothetical protein
MALSFKQTKGRAQKSSVESYEYKDGENTVRLIGGVLPRYVYWVKGTNNKDIPIECLAFSRDKEKFDNLEKDWVPDYHADLRWSWSYAVNCIDAKEGKVKVLNLKKKLFEQILTAAEDLGDPTDPETGWDVVVKRVKTGPLAYNVEYTLQVLRCKQRALNAQELELAEKALPIDEKYPRANPDEIKALLEKLQAGVEEEQSQNDQEAVKELG